LEDPKNSLDLFMGYMHDIAQKFDGFGLYIASNETFTKMIEGSKEC